MNYPGGKGASFRNIINVMPPHDVYIETHLGGGNVMKRKRPALVNFGIDVDPDLVSLQQRHDWRCQLDLICSDAVQFLKSYPFTGRELVYSDPPYLMETRKGGGLYRHEYSDAQHRELLDALKALPCHVILSGYKSDLYMDTLTGWHYQEFQAATRRGAVTESLWLNYRPTGLLHDYRYIGRDFRERERITRQQARWVERFRDLGASERMAMIDRLLELPPPAMPMPATHVTNSVAGSIDDFNLTPYVDPLAINGEPVPIVNDDEHRYSSLFTMPPVGTA